MELWSTIHQSSFAFSIIVEILFKRDFSDRIPVINVIIQRPRHLLLESRFSDLLLHVRLNKFGRLTVSAGLIGCFPFEPVIMWEQRGVVVSVQVITKLRQLGYARVVLPRQLLVSSVFSAGLEQIVP